MFLSKPGLVGCLSRSFKRRFILFYFLASVAVSLPFQTRVVLRHLITTPHACFPTAIAPDILFIYSVAHFLIIMSVLIFFRLHVIPL